MPSRIASHTEDGERIITSVERGSAVVHEGYDALTEPDHDEAAPETAVLDSPAAAPARQGCCRSAWNHDKRIVRYGCRSLILLALCLAYIVVMCLSLLPMMACASDYSKCVVLQRTEMKNMCSTNMQLDMDAKIMYSGWPGLSFYGLVMEGQHNGEHIVTTTVTPSFKRAGSSESSSRLVSGDNYMRASSQIVMGDAAALSRMMDTLQSSGRIEMKLSVHDVRLWLWGFLVPFPITLGNVDIPLTCELNGNNWGCVIASKSFAGGISLEDSFEISTLRVDMVPQHGLAGESDLLVTTTNLTMSMGKAPFVLNLPEVVVDVFVSGKNVDPTSEASPHKTMPALTRVISSAAVMHGVDYGGNFGISATAFVFGGQERQQLVADLAGRYTNKLPNYVYIAGGGGSDQCYIQKVANTMAPFKVLVPAPSNSSTTTVDLALESFFSNGDLDMTCVPGWDPAAECKPWVFTIGFVLRSSLIDLMIKRLTMAMTLPPIGFEIYDANNLSDSPIIAAEFSRIDLNVAIGGVVVRETISINEPLVAFNLAKAWQNKGGLTVTIKGAPLKPGVTDLLSTTLASVSMNFTIPGLGEDAKYGVKLNTTAEESTGSLRTGVQIVFPPNPFAISGSLKVPHVELSVRVDDDLIPIMSLVSEPMQLFTAGKDPVPTVFEADLFIAGRAAALIVREHFQKYVINGNTSMALALTGVIGASPKPLTVKMQLPKLSAVVDWFERYTNSTVQDALLGMIGLSDMHVSALSVQGGAFPVGCILQLNCTSADLTDLPSTRVSISTNMSVDFSKYLVYLQSSVPPLVMATRLRVEDSPSPLGVASVTVTSFEVQSGLKWMATAMDVSVPPSGMAVLLESVSRASQGASSLVLSFEGVLGASALSNLVPLVEVSLTKLLTSFHQPEGTVKLSLAVTEHTEGSLEAVRVAAIGDVSALPLLRLATVRIDPVTLALERVGVPGQFASLKLLQELVGWSAEEHGVRLRVSNEESVALRRMAVDYSTGQAISVAIKGSAGGVLIDTAAKLPKFSSSGAAALIDTCEGRMCVMKGSVVLEAVELLGGDSPGSDIHIPCAFDVYRLCSADTSSTMPPTDVTVGVSLGLRLPLGLEVELETPAVDLVFGSLSDELGGFHLPAISFSSSQAGASPTLTMQPRLQVTAWQKVRRMAKNMGPYGTSVFMRGNGSPGSVSHIIPALVYSFSPDDIARLVPANPEISSNYTISYRTHTTATSAHFLPAFNFSNPVPLEFSLRQLALEVRYQGHTVLLGSVQHGDMVIAAGNNSLVFEMAMIADPGRANCLITGEVTAPCALAEVMKLGMSELEMPISIDLAFTNVYGQRVHVLLNLLVFEPLPSIPTRARLGLIPKDMDAIVTYHLDLYSTLGDLLGDLSKCIFSHCDGAQLALAIELYNPLRMRVATSEMTVDIDFDDHDGALCVFQDANIPLVNVCKAASMAGVSPPQLGYPVLMHMKVFDDGGDLKPGDRVSLKQSIPLPHMETVKRFLDESYLSMRLCVNAMNGRLNNRMLGESDDSVPFDITLEYSLRQMSYYRARSCETAVIPTCTAAASRMSLIEGDALGSDMAYSGAASYRPGAGVVMSVNPGGSGSAFSRATLPVTGYWQAEFSFVISPKPCKLFCDAKEGGFTFVLQGEGSSGGYSDEGCEARKSIGVIDGALTYISDLDTHISCSGFNKMSNAIGVTFSVKRNQIIAGIDGGNRPTVAVIRNGVVSGEVLASRQIMSPRAFDDGLAHHVRVVYDALASLLHVYMDDMSVQVVTASVSLWDMKEFTWVGAAGDQARLGFAFHLTSNVFSAISVSSLAFSVARTDVARSLLEENGWQTSLAGSEGYFFIDARDSCGYPRHDGGDVWEVQLVHSDGTVVPKSAIVLDDNSSGRYRVRYTAPAQGSYLVQARVVGQSESGELTTLGAISVGPGAEPELAFAAA